MILLVTSAPAKPVDMDLLVVGGSESAVAAAVQAARLGVPSIALVNDIDWLGGQFTAEGLCAVDEWTIYKGKRVPFPRSGMFLEIMDRIEAHARDKYGLARPGNSFCAWTTCEPHATERLFRNLIAPYLKANGGPIRLFENHIPVQVQVKDGAVRGVTFRSTGNASERLVVRAKLVIDASDWGDVVRLSGAAYMVGPDLRSRFGEPGAPTDRKKVRPNEMNPITYCMVLRESDTPAVIDKPPYYDVRKYFGATIATRDEYKQVGWPKGTMGPFAPAWRDSTMANGPYGETPSVYTHRRLVDRRHNSLTAGSEVILVNWPLQDYPTYNFPKYVVDQLEVNEPGASKKNLVDMTPQQRELVFRDARHHALGMLYHLQTTVHDKQPDQAVSFRNMKLTDEFDTPDRMPLKPYIREGLRTEALYVLREQDIRDTDGVQSWADHMVPDNLFGYQFNIDFHPTRRIFLGGDNTGPWAHIHSSYRNWGTHTDRAGFPLRSLVPVKTDGLLVAGKNLGYTSIVSSAVRLHGHGMLAGQASGTIAAVCLRDGIRPRDVAKGFARVRRVQTLLVSPPVDSRTGEKVPGVLLWPYHDLPPDADCFVAANQLAIRAILPGDPGLQDFQPDRPVTRREVARAVTLAALSVGRYDDYDYATNAGAAAFRDVDVLDPDYAAVESLARWKLLPVEPRFHPDRPSGAATVRALFKALSWPTTALPPQGAASGNGVTRSQFVVALWAAIGEEAERTRRPGAAYLTPGHDSDEDGLSDLDDALPFDRDNDSLPDILDPDGNNDGVADRVRLDPSTLRRFNFTGRGSKPVGGYVNDHGLKFEVDRGFGWTADISANNRRRGKDADPARDTFLFTRKTDRWECVVENGRYRVTICVGDAGHDQPGQVVTVEGIAAARGQDTKAGQFYTNTVAVDVTDGRLTVDMGTEAPKLNTCLNWLRIMSVTGNDE